MSTIFNSLCQETTDERFIGICDDKPNQKAYLDINDNQKWIATIQNKERIPLTFTAIDNCIEIRKSDGKMDSRCEGILTYNKTIIFIEAKSRKGDASTWAKDADKQIRKSIQAISAKVDLSNFENKKAFIANKLFYKNKQNHAVRIKQFMKETGYSLIINNRIIVD